MGDKKGRWDERQEGDCENKSNIIKMKILIRMRMMMI